jgi:acrylyl-CoA reductase (NADPH)
MTRRERNLKMAVGVAGPFHWWRSPMRPIHCIRDIHNALAKEILIMANTFRAFVADHTDGAYSGGFRDLTLDDLPDEKVLVDISHSSLNYKDGLAVTGKGKIARKFPMVCGIDMAGTVAASADDRFAVGDLVLGTGWGMSESVWGGYAARMRFNPDILTKMPDGFSAQKVMAIGTAGYTAMLAVMALERAGVNPDQGEVLVTGAAGGVGSVATAILSKLGFSVTASTGRAETHEYLRSLGAAEFIAREDLARPAKPLEKARWAAAIDSVGGETLATVLAQSKEEGAVAACGLAGGTDLPTSVMPFILRGVKLLGIIYFPADASLRAEAWRRLGTDLEQAKLDAMTTVEPLSNIQALAKKILKGQTRGRVVIDVNA